MRTVGWRLAGVGLALVLAACSADGADTSTDPTPPSPGVTGDTPDRFETRSPRAAGFKPARLERIVDSAFDEGTYCFAVLREGDLVVERYASDRDATAKAAAFSVTKSVASTLVGIAQTEGLLDIDDRAAKYIPEWRGTRSARVTIRNLLANNSGRQWSIEGDYAGLFGAANWTEYAVGLRQQHPPGERWAYNNSAIQTLDRVLRNATGQDPRDFAEEHLFGPLGMDDSILNVDSEGASVGMAAGLDSTCLDLARFGQLFLQRGEWNGEQVVPSAWVAQATARSSQRLNASYGLLWWVNPRGRVQGAIGEQGPGATPRTRLGRLIPGAPADSYAALGFGGQIVYVDPESQTVVVRMGDPRESEFGVGDAAKVVTEAIND